MKDYDVYVEHNHGFSSATIKAKSLEEAMKKAKELPESDLFFCQHFEVDTSEKLLIRVTDEEDEELEYIPDKDRTNSHLIAALPAMKKALEIAELELVLKVLNYVKSELNYFSGFDPQNQNIDLMITLGLVDEAIDLLNGKELDPDGMLSLYSTEQPVLENGKGDE